MRLESLAGFVVALALASGVVATNAAAGSTPQMIVVTVPASATAEYDTAFTVAADSRTADNSLTGLAVAISASGVCTISGSRVTMASGTGTCTVRFDQAGDATYAPAPEVVETVTATKTDQNITFKPLANQTYKDPNFTVRAITSSGLAPVFSASGSCTVTGASVHLTGAGSCTITASQPGDANYAAAPPVPRTLTVAKAGQSITFYGINDRALGAPDFRLHATTDSKLPISYAAKGACTVTGSRVHQTRAGRCTIIASQAGNANYKAAKSVAESFEVGRPSCSVPRLVGKTLAVAKHALVRSHCGVGSVRSAHASAARRGLVVAQSVRAGRVVATGTKVGLVVGRP